MGIKKISLLACFYLLLTGAFAQANNDSVAYQLQRQKINAMLAVRTQKFGQYDESLNKHTGIFGLQTKNDLRRSNTILMDIVKTDDAIYTELKILLNYRTFQQTQAQNHAHETEENTIGFMAAINKLRGQVEQLKTSAEKQRQKNQTMQTLFIVATILMLATILFLFTRGRNKSKEPRTKSQNG